MNTIYRIIRSAATGQWVVASELAKGRKKGGALKALAVALALAGASFTLPVFASEQDTVEASVAQAVSSAESLKKDGAVEVKGVELLAQTFGMQSSLQGVAPMQARAITPMATGNGRLALCQPGQGSGTTIGYGGQATVSCMNTNAFVLANNGNELGDFVDTGTAQVSGTNAGELLLRGRSGVAIQGLVTLRNGADLANNKITNLAAGTANTDAANLGQLRGVATAAGAQIDANGNIVAPAYNVQGNTHNTLVQALASLDTSVTRNTTNIDNIVEQMKEAGLVDESGSSLMAVAYNADKSAIHLGGTNGTQIKNVADGVDDMDAVNLRQLRQTGMVDENGELMSAVVYNADKSQVMLAGLNGTVLGNVADGQIAAGSKEAVNGGQLAAIRDQLQAQAGDLADRMDNVESELIDGVAKTGAPVSNDVMPQADMGGDPIKNVGDGVEAGDLVNVGQVTEQVKEAIATANQYADKQFEYAQKSLQNFKGEVNDRFRRQDAQIHKIGAMSAANAHMAINAAGVAPGRGRIAVGMGVQRGEQAVALGFAKALSETTRVSVGGAVSGQERSMGASIGVDL